ncbi:MAG TPA: AMP-binding protein [Rhizomicrobium sp.]|jgi:fatty-acyl-CoA synthase
MTQLSSSFEAVAANADSAITRADFIAYHARVRHAQMAVVDLAANRQLTYSELDREIAKCAGFLSGALANPHGARVATLGRNSVAHLVLHFACVRVGAILQPLNWRLCGPELRAQVLDATPELFIYQSEFEEAAKQAYEATSVRQVVRIAPQHDELQTLIHRAAPCEARDFGNDAPITLLYTSGTTGNPKGVIVTRGNAWATAFNFSMTNEVCPGDVLLCDMPLFHVAGLFGVARAALFMGATVRVSDRFIPEVALQRLSDRSFGITHYFAVPQMAMAMLQDAAWDKSDLTRLKALVIGGAPLPKSVSERLFSQGVMPIEGYGISEAGTVTGLPLDREVIARKAGSCGVASMLIDICIAGPDGEEVAAGEVGEMWLKGPSVTPGYWNAPEATAKAFHDGWFKTGDAARRDADGFYQIVDRWKDMFITGGENVYPAEVEAVLVELPAVAEAAVVGVTDERWGECGCAYIVSRSSVTEQDVLAHCQARLARYKIPKHVRFVDALPRTGSGKVKKDALRHAFQELSKERSS